MSNEVFVVASTPARALALAEAEPEPVDGAEGSLVMRADAERVARQVIDALGRSSAWPACWAAACSRARSTS